MKIKFLTTAIAILFILTIKEVKAQLAAEELKNDIIELPVERLPELGIIIKNSTIEFISNEVISSNDSKTTVYAERKFQIKNDKINLKTPKKSELKDVILFPVRLALVKSEKKSFAYFSRITNVSEFLSSSNNDNILQPKYFTDIAENNWKAIHIKLDDTRDVYLWFDPNDLKTKPVELEKLPEPIKDAGFIDDIKIAPNPSRSGRSEFTFNLKSDCNLTIGLYDIAGQKVLDVLPETFKSQGNYNFTINAENLADGMYLLVIQNEKGEMITQKFIKCSY